MPSCAPDPRWRTDTAERPRVDPAPSRSSHPLEAPPVWTTPPPARYPLFADQVVEGDAEPAAAADEPPAWASPAEPARRRTSRAVVGAGIGVALLVGVAAAGVALLDPGDGARPPAAAAGTASGSGSGASEVADQARVEVPATTPPSRDVSGAPVDFEAANLVDGRAGTAWRMPGDGTGETITLTLPRATRLTSVGLVNGYAKTARQGGVTRDWYHGNRRVLRVEWAFDDGTTLEQDLRDRRRLQSVSVDTTTTAVRLRLVEVSAPGRGPARRDHTAISEVSLRAGR